MIVFVPKTKTYKETQFFFLLFAFINFRFRLRKHPQLSLRLTSLLEEHFTCNLLQLHWKLCFHFTALMTCAASANAEVQLLLRKVQLFLRNMQYWKLSFQSCWRFLFQKLELIKNSIPVFVYENINNFRACSKSCTQRSWSCTTAWP